MTLSIVLISKTKPSLMNSTSDKKINITEPIHGLTNGPLEVNYKETTDGIPFYEFSINGQQIQLRKDQKWELMWGELTEDQLEQIGKALDAEIRKV